MPLGVAWSLGRAQDVTFVARGGMVQPGGRQGERCSRVNSGRWFGAEAEASAIMAKNGQGGRRRLGILVFYYVEWG